MAFDLQESIAPYLFFRWFVFHFQEIMHAETQFFIATFFWKKSFVFVNNKISEEHICYQRWFRTSDSVIRSPLSVLNKIKRYLWREENSFCVGYKIVRY